MRVRNPKTLHKEYFGPGQNLTTSKFERHILQLVSTFKKSAPKKNAYVQNIYIYIYVPPIFTWPFGRGIAGRRLFEGLYLSFVVGLNQTGHEQTMKTTGIQ